MNISEHIKASGLSNPKLALLAGVNDTTMWRWSQGYGVPHINKVAGLAYALGCDIADLIPARAT